MKKVRFISLLLALTTIVSTIYSSGVYAVNGEYDADFFSSNNIGIYNPLDNTCPSGSGGEVAKLVGKDNRQKIWNYLTARGLSPQQAAGVMGNMQSESAGSWSPTVNEYDKPFSNDYGYGIVQWTGSRRINLVKSLTSTLPDVMKSYYKEEYGYKASATDQTAGFIPISTVTKESLPTDANDALLLAELNFLYAESNSRTVGPLALEKNLGSKGETEWDALKKAKTLDEASNLWVYSFEVPKNIDTTAVARVNNGSTVFALYATAASGEECTGANGTKKELAAEILKNKNIQFWTAPQGQTQKKILTDIVSGAKDGNTFPCGVNIVILRAIAAIGKDHTLLVNDINRACSASLAGGLSSTSSRHYAGNGSAMDLATIDGKSAYSIAGAKLIVSIIKPIISGKSPYIGQSQCGLPSSAIGAEGIGRFQDGCTHLHIEVSPSADSPLQCKYPVNQGTCSGKQRIN